jgi:DegV family protein with EDD domain
MQQLPTTATASSGTYINLYEDLFRQGSESILSIHAASALSGIFNAVTAAAQYFGNRVSVIDSQQVSMGLGFQVLAAAEAVNQGLPVEAILERLEGIRPRVRLIAMLDTMEYVRRSGRVSWAQAGLGNLLKIKLFVEVKDGIVLRAGEVRTRNKGLARLYELLNRLGKPERLAILHTNAEEAARDFLSNLELPEPPLIVNVTTVIGTHVGPNALGFSGIFA